MRKVVSLSGISVLFILLVANLSLAGTPHVPDIKDTTWKGDITVVDITGATNVFAGAVLTITSQTDVFFSATLTTNPADTTSDVLFSGIIGPFLPADPVSVQMTAPGKVVLGELNLRWGKHIGVDDAGPHGRRAELVLQGSDTADGSTFQGIMVKQAPFEEPEVLCKIFNGAFCCKPKLPRIKLCP